MDVKLLFDSARSLHKEALRAAEAKEYVSYYVFMRRYNMLYVQVCEEMKTSSLPIGQPVLYSDPANTIMPFWAGYLNDVVLETGQLVAFLENHIGIPLKVTNNLINDVDDKLRAIIRKKPEHERDVQDAIESLLIVKEYDYCREKVTIPYSTKYFTPDFTFDTLNTALDVKLCNSPSDEKEIIDQINADIPAYKSKYEHVVFVVYDMGFIRDTLAFVKGFEKNNSDVFVTIVKQ